MGHGAGFGNRTRVGCLQNNSSAIELHQHKLRRLGSNQRGTCLTDTRNYQQLPLRNRVDGVGFEPTISCFRSRRNCQAFPYADRKSAQRESNPHIRHGKAVGCRYIMGALSCFNCQRACDRESTGSDSNRRRRITGARAPTDTDVSWSIGR